MKLTFLALLLSTQLAVGDDHWTLTTADFHRTTVTVLTMEDASAKMIPTGKPEMTLALDDMLRLDRSGAASAAPAKLTAFFLNGDRIAGEPGDLKDEAMHWICPAVGEMKLPLAKLRAVSRLANPPTPAGEQKEDQVTLSNHDVVRGIITGIEEGQILLQSGGNTVPVPVGSVETILFASIGKEVPKVVREWRIRLVDSSIVSARSIRIKDGSLLFELSNGATPDARSTDLANVLSIEQINGPVSWLSDRTPTRNEQTPFSSDRHYPARMNENVFGKPLRAGSEIFDKGIGVHANSKLTYPLDGQYKTFRTRFAIDTTTDASRAAVDVRILLDGKVVHETKDFRAFAMSPPVMVDISGAKELTLEVMAAGLTDTQDRLDWIEAALVRDSVKGPDAHP